MNLCNIQNLRRFWMRNLPFSPWRMLNWAKIHVPHYARVVVRQLPISNLLSCLGTGRLIFVRSHSPSGATIISTTWSFHFCWRLTVCKKIRKYTSYSPILQSLYCPVLFTILKKLKKKNPNHNVQLKFTEERELTLRKLFSASHNWFSWRSLIYSLSPFWTRCSHVWLQAKLSGQGNV